MKLKPFYVQLLITLVIAFIAANQALWVFNMYHLHKRELLELANQAAHKAILMEISERTEIMGGYRVFNTNISDPNDTTRFITKKVRTEDSTYVFKIDKQDPYINQKIVQFAIKDELPVNINVLDSLFRNSLSGKYKIEHTYFEYVDLQTKSIINSNKPGDFPLNYLATDTIPLDIINSIGVIGYIETPDVAILRKMMYQLLLSVLLILIGIGGMVYLGRSFVVQWRTEKLRQQSVNAMTHEFKRPISGAVAMVATIPFYLEKHMFDKVNEYAGKTMNELNKLTAYTQRIQQISNNEKGNFSINRTTLQLTDFFTSIIGKYNKDERLKIDFTNESRRTEFSADIIHFSNVIENLIENAIKYSIENPEILIRISDANNKLRITVSDNGIGIANEDLKRIFDKYYRVNRKETKNKPGFGLGLTYVKSVIDAHGASISVESRLNEGSTFCIII
ncbi:MAG: sensor histidine kinase [Bacteroidia bacterium]|nr:sensor histidine kinase [Bacteroidia bacterium]